MKNSADRAVPRVQTEFGMAGQRVQHRDGGASISKAPDREPRAKRPGNGRANDKSCQADLQGSQRDFNQIAIQCRDSSERHLKPGPDIIHGVGA